MAKNSITDYSTTAASNTDCGGVDSQGSAAASNIDDLIRELMSHLAETNAGTSPWADTMTIGDAADLTKEMRFECSGITTATTRVYTVPNYDGTLATLAGTETFTNKTISSLAATGSSAIITYTDAGAGAGPDLTLYRLSSSPAASDVIGRIIFSGRNTDPADASYAVIHTEISNATAASLASRMTFGTAVSGTLGARLYIGAGLYTPNATGGDKGIDTINASAVYDDNVLLTCYVFDAAIDGEISDAKWDALVPGDAVHADMRRFRDRLGTEYDPLDIDAYTKHWRDKRHLTAMPNEARFDPVMGLPTGTWIQRLIETVEIQAVHIAALNERLKALEA